MLVRKWLENESHGQWVMVVDNADDEQLFFTPTSENATTIAGSKTEPSVRLSEYMPECSHGSILITTRNKKCVSRLVRAQSLQESLVEVPKMSEMEAQELLYRILGGQFPAKDTSALSVQLEHLPLALAQAAAFVHENSISVQEYLELLDESDDAFVDQHSQPFEAVGRDSETPHAVTATWIISFKQIQKENPLASDILSVASLVDRQAIPEGFLIHYCNNRGVETTQGEIIKALGTLKAFSFVTKAKDKTTNMHRLVHLVTRKWLSSQNRFAAFSEHALKTMANMLPCDHHNTRVICQQYLPHAQALLSHLSSSAQYETAELATLLNKVAGYCHYRGHWLEAEDYCRRAFELRKRLLGEKHDDTSNSARGMGFLLLRQGRLKEAEELLQSTMDIQLSVNGEDHEKMWIMCRLGSVFLSQGRLDEAERLFWRILDWCEVQSHDVGILLLNAMGGQSWGFGLQGRLEEAEDMLTQVVNTMERVIGEECFARLRCTDYLARTYWLQGRMEEAEALYTWVKEKEGKMFGRDHPDTLASMHNPVWIWRDCGKREAATRLMRECLRGRQRRLGPDHPRTKSASSILAEWEEEDRLCTGEPRDAAPNTFEGNALDGRPGRRRWHEELLMTISSLFKHRE
ncbi:kinesin light chain [Colletotrichum plurivorum]|uniref:Kinesin light chain n=1 Tax=Colletotrichum plurivorum TaxID=2175906 RepID=A0A8H6NEL4_9PEZI|nr:kinesin light chain [Colletotrichum plurivorum]